MNEGLDVITGIRERMASISQDSTFSWFEINAYLLLKIYDQLEVMNKTLSTMASDIDCMAAVAVRSEP